jgi:hypothetical protein
MCDNFGSQKKVVINPFIIKILRNFFLYTGYVFKKIYGSALRQLVKSKKYDKVDQMPRGNI